MCLSTRVVPRAFQALQSGVRFPLGIPILESIMIVFINESQEISLYFELGQCFDNEFHFANSKILNTDSGELYVYDEAGALDYQTVIAVFDDSFEDEDE